ncbi:TetR/AcrR family transcriptional regulator [Frankia casuarinae]|jgi:AcrR family transcriptional regulator|uniref:TetR/AcrR family transcriptional regulator n=1 Tax=Frankia casuarinae (strain DSM 45818 / CECT 9043 / HFP020203 / CcI3) TaxID=106370 RepID=UPI0006850327|nr:TetR/AcrR family transcriptional regulator [Frankia casuarinae]ORT95539.1 TetR family transcriptional regulator [Frankia casuarinae]
MTVVSSPVPRRERLRQATLDEIKQTARAQLAERGPAALSLRGVARVMGMAPSALYRYVDSREILLAELVADGFASLAEALEAAFDAADPHDHLRRWLQVARAQRRWALDHPTEYGLIFGPGIPCATSTNDRMITQLHRAVAVLFRCMSESTGAGMIDTAAVDAQLTPPMRASLQAWGRDHDVAIDAAGLAVCLAVWTQLHGFISLEMFGHLPPALDDIDELFDRQMADAIIRVWRGGYNLATVMPVPPADRPVAK